MKPKKLLIFSIFVLAFILCFSANRRSNIKVAFYNLENLFDTIDDPAINDNEFTPEGERSWNSYKYNVKINNLYKAIAAIGGYDGVDIMGVCEIENREVLNDLFNNTPLSKNEYRIVHKNSSDDRGIDVALIYKSDRIKLLSQEFIPIRFDNMASRPTRDILYASMLVEKQDTFHVFVNHWPSRYGGELKSRPKRIQTAQVLRAKIDSLYQIDTKVNIIVTGDFNDTPKDISVQGVLKANYLNNEFHENTLYNLSGETKNNSIGTLKYKGFWQIFDQFIVSGNLINNNTLPKVSSNQMHIYNADFLLTNDDNYTGKIPLRTYRGYHWQNGFSDHLPVYIDIELSN